jgi:hypothetical protein
MSCSCERVRLRVGEGNTAGTSESDLDYFVRESGDVLGVSEKVDQERLAANKENKVCMGMGG